MNARSVLALGTAIALCAPLAAGAADLLAEAQAAYGKITGYHATVVVHEIKGSETQDRTYSYALTKPHHVELEITSGPGKGSGGTWDGGDTVSGHIGGIFKGIHKTVSVHDGQATSLRGDTIPSGTIDAMLARPKDVGTDIGEGTGPSIDGAATEAVTYKIRDPAAQGGLTREALYLSKTTHLPVGRDRYEGDKLVKSERVTALTTTPG